MLAALSKNRETLKSEVNVGLDTRLVIAQIGAHFEVFQHAHLRKDVTPFRNLTDAEADNFLRAQPLNGLTAKEDFAAPRRRHAGNRHQGRALACAVGADQRDDLAFVDRQRDVLERLDIAVIGLDIANFKH